MEQIMRVTGAVPTPFGWVVNAQSEFGLEEMLEFRTQLISMSRVFGKGQSPEPATSEAVPAPLSAA